MLRPGMLGDVLRPVHRRVFQRDYFASAASSASACSTAKRATVFMHVSPSARSSEWSLWSARSPAIAAVAASNRGDVPDVVKSAGWMAAEGLVSGIGGLARVIYRGETMAGTMSWPAPRTGAEELAAGAGPSAKEWCRAHGLVAWRVATTTGVEVCDGCARAATSLGRSA